MQLEIMIDSHHYLYFKKKNFDSSCVSHSFYGQESTEVDHRNRSDSNVQAEREKLRHVSTVLEEKELLRIKLEQGISDSPVLSVC